MSRKLTLDELEASVRNTLRVLEVGAARHPEQRAEIAVELVRLRSVLEVILRAREEGRLPTDFEFRRAAQLAAEKERAR